jgi:hypothetical protein
VESGIVTQCLALEYARTKLDDQYLTNVLLKINAKVCKAICIAIFSIMHILVFCLAGNYLNMVFFVLIFQSACWIEFATSNWKKPCHSSRIQKFNHNLRYGCFPQSCKKSNIPPVAAVNYILLPVLALFLLMNYLWNIRSIVTYHLSIHNIILFLPIKLLVPWGGLSFQDTELLCALSHLD